MIDLHSNYICIVELRHHYKGRKLKPKIRKLNNLKVELTAMFQFEDFEFYSDEFAMMPSEESVESFLQAGISWIASGDIKILQIID